MIRIFKRRPWRKEGNRYVPHGGARKTTVRYVDAPDEARAICEPHNAKRPPYGTAGYFNFSFMEWEHV